MSTLSGSISTENDALETGRILSRPMSTPTWIESSSFLNTVDVQMTGGAAGEDRVQVVCSEGNGWLFCGVYDGFNGRDAADFLAGTLHENIGFYLHLLKWRTKQQAGSSKSSLEGSLKGNTVKSGLSNEFETSDAESKSTMLPHYLDEEFSCESFRLRAIDFLCRALAQAENDFMCMVE